MKRKQWFAAALSACIILGVCLGAGFPGNRAIAGEAEPAAARGISVEERALELGESIAVYPAVAGLEDQELEKTINHRILEDTGMVGYITRMSQLISGGKLLVGWRGSVLEDVFSCAVSAEGAIASLRSDFLWTWSNIDLRDGHEIIWDELFQDPPAAKEYLETWLEEQIAPELSAYLLRGNVTPLPDGFCLTRRGLVLLYTREQWCTLNDRAGDLLISWNEIQEVLDLSEGSILERIGVPSMLELTEESLPELQGMTLSGQVPDLPVPLGSSLREAVEAWHLLIDPDLYENGRMISLDGGLFRNVFLLTDALSESWEESRVNGLRLDSGCLFGLRIGQTKAAEWHQMLGEPDMTVEFDEEKAEANRIVPGNRDYYTWEGCGLRLHADKQGVLVSIILTE